MNTHTCIKPACGDVYQSDEEDAYYCPIHVAENKRIAEEVDAKIRAQGPTLPIMSDLQHYDSVTKVRGFASAAEFFNT